MLYKEIPTTFTTGSTFSTVVQIGGYDNFVIEVPTFSASIATVSAACVLNVANTSTATEFRRVYIRYGDSTAVTHLALKTAYNVGGFFTTANEACNFKYARLELEDGGAASVAATNILSAKIHVIKNN